MASHASKFKGADNSKSFNKINLRNSLPVIQEDHTSEVHILTWHFQIVCHCNAPVEVKGNSEKS